MKKLLILITFLISCGPQGNQGPAGQTGPAGSDLNPIRIVQFCLGSTQYPTTFAEVGFCINNEVWAVYSANSGFLTLVPPGLYNSNGINSSCNFEVKTNCVIINH